jgi:hypothetical protein
MFESTYKNYILNHDFADTTVGQQNFANTKVFCLHTATVFSSPTLHLKYYVSKQVLD